jgi:hypothetical protein
MSRDDGGSAFPGTIGSPGYGNSTWRTGPNGENIAIEFAQGMALRDYFAGQALVSMDWKLWFANCERALDSAEYASLLAEASFLIADAMLLERNK